MVLCSTNAPSQPDGTMIRDHRLSPDEARQRTTESMKHHVTEEYFYIPGIG